jgi:hypothetical protein
MFSSNHAFLLVQKFKSAPRVNYTRSQGQKRKKLFDLPQVTNKLCWPQGCWIPSNLRCQFITLVANVVAFINNLGPDKKKKMFRVAPSFFSLNS